MILAVVSGGVAEARDYHVSPSGNDSNPGTHARPWQTIERVNKADLHPGDKVLFEAGKVFPGTIVLGRENSGSPGAKVQLSSYGDGRATINGGNNSGLIARGCNHLMVRDLNFVGSGRKTGNTERGVYLADAEGVTVDRVDISGFRGSGLLFAALRDSSATHVYAHDNGADGIAVGASDPQEQRWSERIYIGYCIAENNPGDPSNLDNHSGNGIVVGCVRDCTIEYCEAMNNGWDMPREGNGPVGIWAWKADKVIIQFCVSHDNKSPSWDGGGFDLDGGVTNSILQYNYSYNNEGPGYFLCQYPTGPVWKDNIVRYNISVNDGFKNNVGAGIEVYGGDERISDAEIYNNTVYNEKGGAVGFGGLPAPNMRFRNNIFVAKGPLVKGDWTHARFEGNLYWTLGDGAITEAHRTLADWIAASGQEKVGDVVVGIYADPLLLAAGTTPQVTPDKLNDLKAYRIKPGSPCIGAGLVIESNGGRDFWGSPIPPGAKPCIGAYQAP